MALDIGIKSQGNKNDPLERDLVVSLEHEEFSFLLDAFEKFEKKTSVRISDCDDARAQGGQLDLLHALIEEEIENVKQKPNKWQEHIGFQIKPRKEIYKTLIKNDLLKKLESFITLIEKAHENERTLFFFGD